jgi:hypothetical protein
LSLPGCLLSSDLSTYQRYCPENIVEDIKQQEELYIYYMVILGNDLREHINNELMPDELTEEQKTTYWLSFWEHPEKFYEILYARENHVFNAHTRTGGSLAGEMFPFYVEDIAFSKYREIRQYDIESTARNQWIPVKTHGHLDSVPTITTYEVVNLLKYIKCFLIVFSLMYLIWSIFDACLDYIILSLYLSL